MTSIVLKLTARVERSATPESDLLGPKWVLKHYVVLRVIHPRARPEAPFSLNSKRADDPASHSNYARAIATIHVEAWRTAYRGIVPNEYPDSLCIGGREAAWRKNLLAADTSTWVVQESAAIVGWISAGPSRDTDAGASAGEIWAVYVAPGCWGKGVGHSLCVQAEQHLRTEGFIAVTLWVLRDNERAVKFYRSNGFVLDAGATKVIERGGKTLSEVRLRKPLMAGAR